MLVAVPAVPLAAKTGILQAIASAVHQFRATMVLQAAPMSLSCNSGQCCVTDSFSLLFLGHLTQPWYLFGVYL